MAYAGRAMIINAVRPVSWPGKRTAAVAVDRFVSAATIEKTSHRPLASPRASLTPTEQDPLALEQYRPEAPLRVRLHELDEPGTRFHLTGTVRGTDGYPVEFAEVEVWLADAAGEYHEDSGRGRQMAGLGAFHFHSVRPGAAPERPACLHVKVKADGYHPLATRLFFDGEGPRVLRVDEVGFGQHRFQISEFDLVLRADDAG